VLRTLLAHLELLERLARLPVPCSPGPNARPGRPLGAGGGVGGRRDGDVLAPPQMAYSGVKIRTRCGATYTVSPARSPSSAYGPGPTSTFTSKPYSTASNWQRTTEPAGLTCSTLAFRLAAPPGSRSMSSSCGRT